MRFILFTTFWLLSHLCFADISLIQYFKTKESFTDKNELTFKNAAIEKQIEFLENRPLLKNDAEILLGLYQKIFRDNKKHAPLPRVAALFLTHPSFQDYYFDFWSEINSQFTEKIRFYNEMEKNKIKLLISSDEILFVDGRLMSGNDVERISKLPHQWLLISNHYYPVLSVGSFDLFLSQVETRTPFNGRCGEPILPFKNVESLSLNFFDLTCPPQISLHKESAPRLEDSRRSWLLPAGLLLGAVALTALKEKKVIIKIPAFKF
jgi:hypothetical protein